MDTFPCGGLGPIQKCEMRMSRLHHLNSALDASSKASWAQSDGTELLLARFPFTLRCSQLPPCASLALRAAPPHPAPCPGRLQHNPFFHALRVQIAWRRKQWLERHVLTKASADGFGAAPSPMSDPTAGLHFWEEEPRAAIIPLSPRELLADNAARDQTRGLGGETVVVGAPSFAPSLTMKASECSTEAVKELAALRALETRAQDTVQNMYLTLASVLPVCKEEVTTHSLHHAELAGMQHQSCF